MRVLTFPVQSDILYCPLSADPETVYTVKLVYGYGSIVLCKADKALADGCKAIILPTTDDDVCYSRMYDIHYNRLFFLRNEQHCYDPHKMYKM